MKVQTPQNRIVNVKQALVGTGLIIAVLSGGSATDYYLVPNVVLAGERFTKHEYSQLRPSIMQLMRDRTQLPSYKEVQMFIDAFNLEHSRVDLSPSGDKPLIEKMIDLMEAKELKK